MSNRHIRFETITHAAGISSTGDKELDALLPLDEPYRIPLPTALAIEQAQAHGNRIIAVGTTVVRALEELSSAVRWRGTTRRIRCDAKDRPVH